MIHLDTSYLIRALVPASAEDDKLRSWLRRGESFGASTMVWGEFLCGPVDGAGEALALRLVRTLIPVGTEEAREAARLFNASGRRRGSFQDCLVAATAIVGEVPLATANTVDFRRFLALGLRFPDGE
ncbi:MAG: PIN domain-containing protein [Longimicrobiales bacterium]|nr:PIN domain-containing protein [Longimicrobiales bacterium]